MRIDDYFTVFTKGDIFCTLAFIVFMFAVVFIDRRHSGTKDIYHKEEDHHKNID